MSNHLISTAYKRDLGTGTRKAVMVYLADKASDDGRGIYASKQTMADELNLSKKTMIDVIQGLVDDGLLVKIGERRCVNGYTVQYAIDVVQLEGLALVACHQKRAERSRTGEARSPVKDVHRCADFTGTGEAASPKPLLEPITPHTPHVETDVAEVDAGDQYWKAPAERSWTETPRMLKELGRVSPSQSNRKRRRARSEVPKPDAMASVSDCEASAARYRRMGNERQARYWDQRAQQLRSASGGAAHG